VVGRHGARRAIGRRPVRRREFPAAPAKADLDVLKAVPEKKIKQAFAEIISESEVPKDWGGEQFDLWTTVMSVEGQRLRAAIALKGPARFRPMTIASLGKNGDQIDRLAQTAADLMVVQHCHTMTATVVNMLKAYASNFRDPKRFMLIDGLDTIRILRHFGYLSLPPRHWRAVPSGRPSPRPVATLRAANEVWASAGGPTQKRAFLSLIGCDEHAAVRRCGGFADLRPPVRAACWCLGAERWRSGECPVELVVEQ
jgi:hypothetical protein